MILLIILWPAAWMLFLPVVALQARFLQVRLGWAWKACLKVSALSNFFSILVGIPLAWLAAMLLDLLVMIGLGNRLDGTVGAGLAHPGLLLVSTVLFAPLPLPPMNTVYAHWHIPLSVMVLCPLLYAAFALCGKRVLRRVVDARDRPAAQACLQTFNRVLFLAVFAVLAGTVAWELEAMRNVAFIPNDGPALRAPHHGPALVGVQDYVGTCLPWPRQKQLLWVDASGNTVGPVLAYPYVSGQCGWSADGTHAFVNDQRKETLSPFQDRDCLAVWVEAGKLRTESFFKALDQQNVFPKTAWKHDYDSLDAVGSRWMGDRILVDLDGNFFNGSGAGFMDVETFRFEWLPGGTVVRRSPSLVFDLLECPACLNGF